MLFGGDVAEHRGAEPADHRGADGAGDVVVAGGDVGGERPQGVEGRLTAGFELLVHVRLDLRSEEHTSELQSLMRISYAVFCLKKKKTNTKTRNNTDAQNS